MFRKFSAIAFLLVMTMVITLKHPVLGYCMCLDAYFTGGCACQSSMSASLKPTKSTDDDSDSNTSCCGSCASIVETQEPDTPPEPCDDCVKQLIVDVGQFHWQSSDNLPSDTETLLPAQPTFWTKIQTSHTAFYTPTAIRGDPPPDLARCDLPIFLMHSVFRL